MKKYTLLCCLVASALLLCSCQSTVNKSGDEVPNKKPLESVADSVDKILSTDPEPLRTVEYSVVYIDRNTGLSSFDTASLEQSEPITAAFLFDKVVKLSGFSVSALSVVYENSSVIVDFEDTFFVSEQNTEKNEASLLCSLYQSFIRNIDGTKAVYFRLSGGDFITAYHAFDSDEPFLPEQMDEPNEAVEEIPFTVSYYDIYTDENAESKQIYRYVGQPDPLYYIRKISELYSIPIGVHSITVKDKSIIVDYDGTKAPSFGTGSYEESRILDCVADVLLQVTPDADAVYITKDGGDYDSGHIKSERETPYATRKQNRIG